MIFTLLQYTVQHFLLFENISLKESMELDPEETKADFYGCEFDYTSNTYRLHVTLSAGSCTIGENFMVIKVDGATGHPKICSIR